jgi:hypothetical protein
VKARSVPANLAFCPLCGGALVAPDVQLATAARRSRLRDKYEAKLDLLGTGYGPYARGLRRVEDDARRQRRCRSCRGTFRATARRVSLSAAGYKPEVIVAGVLRSLPAGATLSELKVHLAGMFTEESTRDRALRHYLDMGREQGSVRGSGVVRNGEGVLVAVEPGETRRLG